MKTTILKLMILLIPIICSGCAWKGDTSEDKGDEWVKKIDAPEIVHAIQHYLPYLKYEKHLRLEESKVYYDDSINTIRMEFICMDVMEIKEARRLLVDLVEGLLAELNKNPILGPEFITYPLTPAQLEIYVDFQSYYGLYIDTYFVGWMKLEKDTSTFYAYNIKYPGMFLPSQNSWNYRVEPYFKSREYVVFERESEDLFQQTVELEENTPDYLKKEQYRPVEKCRPRWYSPYSCDPIFEK